MSSKTDQVILYLTSLWQGLTSTTLTGVQVADGPQVNSDASQQWLFVGFDGDTPTNQNQSATMQQDFLAFHGPKFEEGEILCAAVTVQGPPEIPAVRQQAYAIVSAAEDAIRADMTLGGLVMQAIVSGHNYYPVQTTSGAKVRVVFTVRYKVQI